MKDFRVLIAGAGQMGRAWGKNLRDCPDTEVVAWVDLLPDAAAHAADGLVLRDIFTGPDLEDAIVAARPDFVVDASPPGAHRDVVHLGAEPYRVVDHKAIGLRLVHVKRP